MIRIFTLLIILLSVPALLLQTVNAEQTLYLKVDYFKAAGPQISEYLEVELDLWKPLHEERCNRGIIKSWDFYGVVAGEPDVPYNFIAVNVFDDFNKIDYYDLNDIIGAVYPKMDIAEMMKRTRSSREVVRTEIWQVNRRIMDDGQQAPAGNYLVTNYFDARNSSGEYMELELDFWGPIHETRINSDILNSWAMYTLLYPDGDSRHYTYWTVDYCDKLGDLQETAGMPLAKIAHPGLSEKEIDGFFGRTEKSRTLFKTEVWKRIDSIGSGTD